MPWSVAFMVVMIVLITAIAKTTRSRHQALGRHPDTSADHRRAEQEILALKERIAVLERVVTENHGSIDLDRQIERLRDR